MEKEFDVNSFDVKRFDEILSRGLSHGLGKTNGRMCIEAAICNVMGLPHGDDPGCVADAVRIFKIALNDQNWSSPKARAKGLRDLGLAQLGSKGVVDDKVFLQKLSEGVIKRLLPQVVRDSFSDEEELLLSAEYCEKVGTAGSAAEAAYDSFHPKISSLMIERLVVVVIHATDAAIRASRTQDAEKPPADRYLLLMAQIALDVLKELNSPGVALL